MTCSAELCTGATGRSPTLLIHSKDLVDSAVRKFSKRSAAVVRSEILETNVSVPIEVVPTRSARVIAVGVSRSG